MQNRGLNRPRRASLNAAYARYKPGKRRVGLKIKPN
nr:MAG TPA: hypothetical protein [Caudoviricetes sp.]